jgi:hypothetical protein
MLSSNIKRSVATLGVVVGLLATAGPASAGVRTDYERNGFSPQAPASDGVVPDAGSGNDTLRADDEMNTCSAETEGTQVGSEGVKGNSGAAGREPLSFDCAELVEWAKAKSPTGSKAPPGSR